jgi:outer membrane biosynthesis protein TonB
VSSPSLSPSPPESRGRGAKTAIIIACVSLAVLAAVLVSLLRSEPAAEPAPTPAPAKAVTPAAQQAEPPPPPPPEPEPQPAAVIAAPEAKPAEAPKAGPKKPKGCEVEECKGNAGVDIHGALRAKAGQVRSCYERALVNNAGLQGKVEVDVRIAPSGEVCSAGIAKETLGDPAVLACVLQRFRSGQFPKPSGGCIDTRVPINFVPPQL